MIELLAVYGQWLGGASLAFGIHWLWHRETMKDKDRLQKQLEKSQEKYEDLLEKTVQDQEVTIRILKDMTGSD